MITIGIAVAAAVLAGAPVAGQRFGCVVTAGGGGGGGSGSPVAFASMSQPWPLAWDSNGGMFIGELLANRLSHVAPTTSVVTTISVNLAITGIAVGTLGRVYMSQQTLHRMAMWSPATGVVSYAGTGVAGSTGDGGPASLAQTNLPQGMSYHYLSDTLAVAESGSWKVRVINITSGIITTLATVLAVGNCEYHQTPARMLYVAGQNELVRIAPDGSMTQLAGSLNAAWGLALLPDASGLYFGLRGAHTIHYMHLNNNSYFTVAGSGQGFADRTAPLSAAFNTPRGLALGRDGVLYIGDVQNNRLRAAVPQRFCDLPARFVGCRLTPAGPIACDFADIGAITTLSVSINGVSCPTVTPIVNASATATCFVPPPLPYRVLWTTIVGSFNATVDLPAPMASLRLISHNLPAPLGGVASFHVEGSIAAFTASVVLLPSQQSVRRLPCMNATFAEAGSNPVVTTLNCTLTLALEEGFTGPLLLQMALSNGGTVSLAINSSAPFLRPRLPVIAAPVLSTGGGQVVVASLSQPVPSIGEVADWASSLLPVCGGLASRLRCWVGATPCPSCTWVNTTAVTCAAPSGTAAFARLTVEVCGQFNATSDGAAPAAALTPAAGVASYVSYVPAALFSGLTSLPRQTVRHTSLNTFHLPVIPTLWPLLDGNLLTSLHVAGVACPTVTGNATMLVCSGWSAIAASLPFPPEGTLDVTLAADFRGQRVTLPSLLVVAAPRLDFIDPPTSLPGGCISVYGSWLTPPVLTPPTLSLGPLTCTSVTRVSFIFFSCCLPSVVPVTTPGFPFLPAVIRNLRGVSEENATVQVLTALSVAIASPSGARTAATALPVLAAGAGGGSGFTRLDVQAAINGSSLVTCSLALVASACPTAPSFSYDVPMRSTPLVPALSGASPTSVSLLTQIAATVTFPSVALVARFGCNVTVGVDCTDDLRRAASTAPGGQLMLTVPIVTARWSAGTPGQTTPLVLPPDVGLPPVALTIDLSRAATNATASTLWTCLATVVPSSIVPPTGFALAPLPQSLSTVTAAVTTTSVTVSTATFAGLATSGAALGQLLALHAECVYTPTEERIRLAPLALAVPNVTAAAAATSGLVDGYTPFHVAVSLAVHPVAPFTAPAHNFSGAAGTCRIVLASASSPLVALSSTSTGATYSVLAGGGVAPNITAVLEAPPLSSAKVEVVCTVWGRTVLSNHVALTTRAFMVAFQPPLQAVTALPSSSTTQDAASFFPLPALTINTSATSSSVACTVTAGTSWCPPRGFRGFGAGFVSPDAPVAAAVGTTSVVSTPTGSGSVVAGNIAVRAASGCVVSLAATCRDGVGRENATALALNVTLPELSATWWLGGSGLDVQAAWLVNGTAVTVPPSPFPTIWMQMRESGGQVPAGRLPSWSCAALLADGAVPVPTTSTLSSFSRGVGAYAEAAVPAAIAAGPPSSQASLAITTLDATSFPLGSHLRLHGECVWTPTGERVRLLPLEVRLPNVSVAMTAVAAAADAVVDGYQAFNASVVVDAWAEVALCGVEVASASTPLLVQSSLTAARRVSVRPGVPAAVEVMLEGPPLSYATLVARCQLWGGAYTISSTATRVHLRAFTVEWAGAAGSTPRVVLPSSATSSDPDAFFSISPPLQVSTSLQSSVVCTLQLAPVPAGGAQACPFGAVALAGTLSAAVTAVSPSQTTALVAIPGAGMRGGFGCQAAVAVVCRDALNRNNSTAAYVTVTIPAATMAWTTPTATINAWQLSSPLTPLPLPATQAAVTLQTSSLLAHTSSAWQCVAVLLPGTWTLMPSVPLSSLPRSAGSFADGTVRIADVTAVASFAGLDATFLPLNASAQAVAECVWLPTGERLRSPVWHGAVADVSVSWISSSPSVVALPGQPTTFDLHVRTSALVTSFACIWRTTNSSSSLLLQSAGVSVAQLTPGATLLQTTVTLQGPTGAALVAVLECAALGKVLLLPPVPMRTSAVTITTVTLPSPLSFIPSEPGAPWLLRPGLAVRLESEDGTVARSVTCRLFSSDPAAQLHATGAGGPSSLASGVSSDPATGLVAFPLFGVQMAFNATTSANRIAVGLQVLCSTAGGDTPPPLVVAVTLVHMRAVACVTPQWAMPSGDGLPPFTVHVSAGETLPPDSAAACADGARPPPSGIAWPLVSCSALDGRDGEAAANNGSVLIVGGGTQSSATGSVTFPRVTITGAPGETYPLQVACSVGGIPIPTIISSTGRNISVRLTGCRAGQQVIDITCVPCPAAQFSLGDVPTSRSAAPASPGCRGCPTTGARCSDGVLSLLPNFYRPVTQASAPIGPDAELHPCFNTEACVVFNATASVTHACASGYAGPLCGVCAPGYAFFGPVCRPCWSEHASNGLLAVLILAVLALLTYLALRRSDGTKRPASIALKILLSYVQAVGSLKAFQAGGTRAYREVMGWTDTLSASPFSVGALQCVVQRNFLAEYLAILALPLLASAALASIFVVVTTLRHVKIADGRLALATDGYLASLRAWWGERRHVSLFLFAVFVTYMSLISASLRALDCVGPIDGVRYLRSDLAVPCDVGQQAVARVFAGIALVCLGVGVPAAMVAVLSRSKPARLLQPESMAAWGFLYDGYRTSFAAGSTWHVRPPMLSALSSPSLPPADEAERRGRAESDDGSGLGLGKYAVNPLRVDTGARAAGVSKAEADPAAPIEQDPSPGGVAATPSGPEKVKDRRLLALLTACMPRHLLWWEAVVLLRKVAIVLLAVLVTDPYAQCAGAILLLTACLGGQLLMQPFSRPLFNLLESWSLAAAVASATLSTLLLQYAGSPDFAAREAPGMDGKEWFVTVSLAAVNLLTLVVLAAAFLRLQLTEVRAKARIALSKSARLRNSVFLRGGRASSKQPPPLAHGGAAAGVVKSPSPTTDVTAVTSPLHAVSTRRIRRSSNVAPAQPPVTAFAAGALSPLRTASNSSMPDAPDTVAPTPGTVSEDGTAVSGASATAGALSAYRPGRTARRSLGVRNTFAAVGLPRRATMRGALGLPPVSSEPAGGHAGDSSAEGTEEDAADASPTRGLPDVHAVPNPLREGMAVGRAE